MLEWIRELTGIVIEASFMQRIQPENMRHQYLRHWIRQNYSDRFLDHSLIVQTAFTLPAHNKLLDKI